MYRKFGWFLIIIGIIFTIYITVYGNFTNEFSSDMLAKYGNFIGGTVGIIFSLAGYFLVFEGLNINKKNQFENTFFNILSNFNDFRNSKIGLVINTREKTEIKSGYEFFEFLMHKQINPYKEEISKIEDNHIKNQMKIHKSQLSQYYGQLNMIIYKIEHSNLNNYEKTFYMEYLSSILTEIENFLIKRYDLVFASDKFKYLRLIS